LTIESQGPINVRLTHHDHSAGIKESTPTVELFAGLGSPRQLRHRQAKAISDPYERRPGRIALTALDQREGVHRDAGLARQLLLGMAPLGSELANDSPEAPL
jgi:hypothetical protein